MIVIIHGIIECLFLRSRRRIRLGMTRSGLFLFGMIVIIHGIIECLFLRGIFVTDSMIV